MNFYQKLRKGCDLRNRYEYLKSQSAEENKIRLEALQHLRNRLSKGTHTRTILFHELSMIEQVIEEQTI